MTSGCPQILMISEQRELSARKCARMLDQPRET